MFLDDLKNCKNIYDIMALSYSYLLPYHNSKGNNCDFTYYKEINDVIAAYYESNNISSLIEEMIEIINRFYEINQFLFFNLTVQIDASAKFIYPKTGPRHQSYQHITALNTNSNKLKIFIFPKMRNTIINEMEKASRKLDKKGLRQRAKKQNNDSINYKLTNFVIYYDPEYCPSLSILTDSNIFSNRIQSRNALNIGIIPLTSEDIFTLFDVDESQRDTFSIKNAKTEKKELILNTFKKQLSYFKNKDVDIIIFPEMYLIDEIIDNIKDIVLTSLDTFYCDDKSIRLIIAGTHWKNQNNICYVIDNYGNIVYKQNKFEPYEYHGKLEDLNVSDYLIHILDIYNIGRLLTLVCKDISNEKLYNLFLDIRGDIVLHPAYSPSLDTVLEAEKYTRKSNCISVFANACASRADKKEIGFCSTPQRTGTSSSAKITKYGCLNDCAKNCQDCTSPRILSIEFNNFISNKQELSCKVSMDQN